MALPKEPITRKERFLAGIAGSGDKIPEPITREEQYLAYIAKNGISGGGDTASDEDVITPTDAKEIFDRADPTPNGGSSEDTITPEEAKEIFDNADPTPNGETEDFDGDVDDEF